MTKENIKLFSEMHAEPQWFGTCARGLLIDDLELPVIERVKFHRWNLGRWNNHRERVNHSLLCQTSLRLTIN